LPAIPAAIVKPGYRPQSSDTSIDADVLLFGLLRQLSPERKAVRVQRLDRAIRQLSPVKFVIEDPIGLALTIAARLEALGIPYYVGGSLASSLWGEPRYSEDLDLVIEADSRWIQQLVDGFNADFYLSETAIAEAFDRRVQHPVTDGFYGWQLLKIWCCRSCCFELENRSNSGEMYWEF
jgi:hypothetical protein